MATPLGWTFAVPARASPVLAAVGVAVRHAQHAQRREDQAEEEEDLDDGQIREIGREHPGVRRRSGY